MNILAFGAHPDDVEVGMGGTVKRYTEEGHQVFIVSVCVPDGLQQRRKEAAQAATILGAAPFYLNMPLEQVVPDIRLITQFDALYQKVQPDVIYTHWIHDSHQDHRAVAKAAISVARENKCPVYMYELIPGGIVPFAFRAQRYIDISEQYGFKLAALKEHKSQVDRVGKRWFRGIRGLAMYRGFQMGVLFAEAFEIVKDFVPAGRPIT